MMFKGFSIWDEKARAFLPPFFLPETAVAVRSFADCVNDPAHAFGRNPHDYTLFVVGAWDDAAGLLVSSAAELVVTGPGVMRRAESATRDMFSGGRRSFSEVANREDSK